MQQDEDDFSDEFVVKQEDNTASLGAMGPPLAAPAPTQGMFNDKGQMAEHWDVVQPHPEPGYDPMRPSTANLERFKTLFNLN